MAFVLIYVIAFLGCCLSFGYLIYDRFKDQQTFTIGDLGVVLIMVLAALIPYVNVFVCAFGIGVVIDTHQHVVIFSRKDR